MKKFVSAFLAAVLILTGISPTFIGEDLTVSAENTVATESYGSVDGSYNEYIDNYSSYTFPDTEVTGSSKNAVTEYEGFSGSLLNDTSNAEYSFNVENEGLYAIKLSYVAYSGNNLSAEYSLKIDGKALFDEFSSLVLYKLYRDVGEPTVDNFGNEVRAEQEEVVDSQTVFITDSTGYINGELFVYFSKGEHTLSFTSVRGDVLIQSVSLAQPEAVPDKDTSIQSNQGAAKQQKIVIEAEKPYLKSSSMLFASCDKSSYLVSPYPNGKEKINVLGGSNFSSIGQWIDYKFKVEESGYYAIALKYKQNVSIGMTSYRNIYIDGKMPNSCFKGVAFPYSTKWKSISVSDGNGNDVPVWLDKGEHTLRLEVTFGSYSDILAIIQSSVREFNQAYLESIMYLTTSPDINRDYDVEKNLPNVLKVFEEQIDVLKDLSDRVKEVSGSTNDSVALVDRMIYQLENIIKKPETYPKRLEQVKSNITALAALITDFSSQPLTIDYLTVYTEDCTLDKPEANILQNAYNEIINFLYTFSASYNTTSSESSDDGIVVWVPTGRDQYKVIGNLIDNSFTPEYEIPVQLKLVPVASLLSAVIAGKGPDVMVQIVNTEPMNYAVRGAVYDLNTFEDCDDILTRFSDAACQPLRLGNSLYALPETETFYMMFYRTDILADLGLSVPETWEDFIVATTELQKNNLAVGLPSTLEAFGMFLTQGGGSFYKDTTYECNINTSVGLKAFTKYTDMFLNYGLPLTYDALTRFRMGEMPIVINDYTFFNNLQVGAPEIANLWDFTIVPGTVKEDGSVDHTVPIAGNACMMLSSTKNPEKAWKFMTWWTSAQTQIAYGRNMEMTLGTSGRVPTANIEATKALAWSKRNSTAIENARKSTYGIENVPGSYFMSRHILNAFRKVVISGDDAKESLRYYSKIINNEILTKCNELGISLEREDIK